MDVADERIVPLQGCDHRSMCRFAGRESEAYKAILNVLQDWDEELNECKYSLEGYILLNGIKRSRLLVVAKAYTIISE